MRVAERYAALTARTGAFSSEEDEAILAGVEEHGTGAWEAIVRGARELRGRTGWGAAQRYAILDSRFSEEQDEAILTVITVGRFITENPVTSPRPR
eukprot:6581136-Prymnesium_polylepis.1